MPWGDTPAAFALNLIMADHATHSWDLTRATGLTIEIPAATAETALATTQASVTPEFPPPASTRPNSQPPRARPRSIDSPHSADVPSNQTAARPEYAPENFLGSYAPADPSRARARPRKHRSAAADTTNPPRAKGVRR